jgi:hypothetical protein
VVVRRDHNLNVAADAADAVVAGAALEILLVEYATGRSVTMPAVTDDQGVFVSKVFGVGAGPYYAEIVSLAHPNYDWLDGLDPAAGNDADFNANGLPDQWYEDLAPSLETRGWHNESLPDDVNGDGWITNLDALLVVGMLRSSGPGRLDPPVEAPAHSVDVSGDGHLNPEDALLVISRLRRLARSETEHPQLVFTEEFFHKSSDDDETELFARQARHDEALLAYLAD